jgi:DNA phosphorothioation-dependent restriction protein DptG
MDTCFLGAGSNVSVPARQQYLFFIANIIIKDRELSNLSPAFFFRVTQELMRHYQGYLDFNARTYRFSKRRQTMPPKTRLAAIVSKVSELVRGTSP